MMSELAFETYQPRLRDAALALFDANCPEFFAPNERADFEAFLDAIGGNYSVLLADGRAIAAYGLVPSGDRRVALRWILAEPASHGAGLGRRMMTEALRAAEGAGAAVIDIAASHLSAPFFARFGAAETRRTENGWGSGMHRVDMELAVSA